MSDKQSNELFDDINDLHHSSMLWLLYLWKLMYMILIFSKAVLILEQYPNQVSVFWLKLAF